MALRISVRAITSDITPETAHLVPGPDGGSWALSWLPGWDLTRDQAIDGMALDEMLSDPAPEDGEWALEMAALRAESLGMGLEDVVVRLCARIIERDRQRGQQAGQDRPPGDNEGRSCSGSTVAQDIWRLVRPRWVETTGVAVRRIIVALLWAGPRRRMAKSAGAQR
ncbi:hypothetical protein GPX89_09815 [Nocardia sp. ET3-3]|uniref:Uncharacterized protein n=1 Tax=Nocardia terrae TaxID=2675851 RepID=A0A7K1UUJ7_9NOCA|nr:hypothetical protein [Nocardia terrae]MVU77538.1 hypothetical protein [Nocardia terrae]